MYEPNGNSGKIEAVLTANIRPAQNKFRFTTFEELRGKSLDPEAHGIDSSKIKFNYQ